jgi:uncharacterized membrane protein
MTDQPTQPTPEEPVIVAAAAVGDESGIKAEGAVAIQGTKALLVARFADAESAGVAYDALRTAEFDRGLLIDGVLVVDAGADGKINIRKMTDHHTRRGTKWGVVAGGALALIFPPTLLAGMVAGGAIGAVIGKAGNLMTRGQVASELATVITPNSSGIVALLDLSAVDEVKATIPQASEVKAVPVDEETAAAVTEAAKSVEEAPAG